MHSCRSLGLAVRVSILLIVLVLMDAGTAAAQGLGPFEGLLPRTFGLFVIFGIVGLVTRHRAIGGWLMMFVLIIYADALVVIQVIPFLADFWRSSVTSVSFSEVLNVISLWPPILVTVAVAIALTLLLVRRDARSMLVFRISLFTLLGVSVLSTLIRQIWWSIWVPMQASSAIEASVFLLYFYRSKRVDVVFRLHDWENWQIEKSVGVGETVNAWDTIEALRNEPEEIGCHCNECGTTFNRHSDETEAGWTWCPKCSSRVLVPHPGKRHTTTCPACDHPVILTADDIDAGQYFCPECHQQSSIDPDRIVISDAAASEK